MAAAATIAGWRQGPFWVAPVCAAGALLLIFALGRDLGLSRPACAAAAAMLAAHAAFFFEALQPMSDVPATAWALAVLLCARRSRANVRWAPAAGFAFGVAFLVRPASVLVLVPCLVFLGFDRRRLSGFAAGGALPFAFFVAYNRAAFGHPFQTGYGEEGLWRELAWGNFVPRVRHYAHWLSTTLTGLVLLGWLVAPFDRQIARRDRAALFLWFAIFLLFYCFYNPYETWWYLRFLLPALPALILAFLLASRDALRLIEPRFGGAATGRFASVLAIGIVLLLEIRQFRRLGAQQIVDDQVDYTEAAQWARERLPSNALAIAMQMSGTLHYYTSIPIVRWDTLAPEDFRRILSTAEGRGYRIFALLFPFEEDKVRTRAPGAWVKIAALRDVSVWTRAAPGTSAENTR
jgi:4-amino-4-deoxy-L-arabinose transferase-like glycosyltransferase